MKIHYLIIVTGIAIISVILNVMQYDAYSDKKPTYYINDGLNFVWNDDLESIPADGTPIMLEYTDKDTVYLSPMEVDATQYQFTVIDNIVAVYDGNRRVGTIKLDGSLKQLINKDNE